MNFSIFFVVLSKFTKTVRIALERRRTPLAISVCDGGALLFKQDEERPGDGGGYGGFCPLFQPRSTRVWFRNRDEKNEREKCDSRCVDEPIPRERFLPEGSRRRWPRKKNPFECRGSRKKNKKNPFFDRTFLRPTGRTRNS